MQHWTGTHMAPMASEHASFRISVVQLCRLLSQHMMAAWSQFTG